MYVDSLDSYFQLIAMKSNKRPNLRKTMIEPLEKPLVRMGTQEAQE